MMSFPRFAFRVIDISFNLPQNLHFFKNIHKDKDIVYDESDPKVCMLDIYRHKDKVGVKLPTIINFPGGGFMAGNKKYRKGIASYFVTRLDVCVINVNYHVCEHYQFPKFTQDCMKAIQWVKDHAEEYNLDLDQLYVMGDSAGAQMAAHTVTILQNPELAEAIGCVRPDVKFKGAILGCGIYDIEYALDQKVVFDLAHGIGTKVMGADSHVKENVVNYPLKKYLTLLDWIQPGFPPTFVCHTNGDIVCMEQGNKIISVFEEKEVPFVSYYSTKKKDFHCWYLCLSLKSAKLALEEMVKFMKTLLAGEPIETKKMEY